jgi:putative endonuclease
MTLSPLARQSFGQAGEDHAAETYRSRGAGVIARRQRLAGAEIDLIAEDSGVIVFAEVKSRRTLEDAAFALDPRQSRRLMRAAEVWLDRNGRQGADIRFDAVLIDRSGNTRILENAFAFAA